MKSVCIEAPIGQGDDFFQFRPAAHVDRGMAPENRERRARHQRNVQFPGGIVEPFRIGPVVRQVLVAKNGDGPSGAPKKVGNLTEETAFGIHDLPRVGSRVVSVLGHQENAVHRKGLVIIGEGRLHTLRDRHSVLVGEASAQIVFSHLIDVEGTQCHRCRLAVSIKSVGLEKPGEDDIGVRVVVVDRRDTRHLWDLHGVDGEGIEGGQVDRSVGRGADPHDDVARDEMVSERPVHPVLERALEIGVIGIPDRHGTVVDRLLVTGGETDQPWELRLTRERGHDAGPHRAVRSHTHGATVGLSAFHERPDASALQGAAFSGQIVGKERVVTHGHGIECFEIRADLPVDGVAVGIGEVGFFSGSLAVDRLAQLIQSVGFRIIARNLSTANRMIGATQVIDHNEGVDVPTIHQVAIGSRL